jgi:hypothetical protein
MFFCQMLITLPFVAVVDHVFKIYSCKEAIPILRDLPFLHFRWKVDIPTESKWFL